MAVFEQENELGKININIINEPKPYQISYTKSTTAEDVVISLCKILKIKPILRPLFAIKEESTNVWLYNSFNINDLSIEKSELKLILKIRFKPEIDFKSMATLCLNTFNYFFQQIRSDVLTSKMDENRDVEKFDDKLLGLVATDMYRAILEEGRTRKYVIDNYKLFTPKKYAVTNGFFEWLKSGRTFKAIVEVLDYLITPSQPDDVNQNDLKDPTYVKQCYLERCQELFPNYLSEEYRIIIKDSSEKTRAEAVLILNPFCPKYPGISVKYDPKSNDKIYLCAIEDICSITIINKDNDKGNIHIARKNGTPIIFTTYSMDDMYSIISLLDGYYRLMVKWTFNLCRNIYSPSLEKLLRLKAHGPVSGLFSYKKLIEKGNYLKGCYILRESDRVYGDFYLDVCCEDGSHPKTFLISQNEAGLYVIKVDSQEITSSSIPELISSLKQPTDSSDCILPVKFCIPSSEFDDSDLLICKSRDPSAVGSVLPDYPLCINVKHLEEKSGYRMNSQGKITVAFPGIWKRPGTIRKDVVIKKLVSQSDTKYLAKWLDLIQNWCCLDYIHLVKVCGVTLSKPAAMICEDLPLGPLNKYLSHNSSDTKVKVKEIDLVQAATCLSSALWYLKEAGFVHGNIRCHNLLVSTHTEDSFVVKLSDPGLRYSDNYPPNEWPFLPPEEPKKSFAADVWACGTTLWQIFSNGDYPNISGPLSEQLPLNKDLNSNIRREMYFIIKGCRQKDKDNRKTAQSIMRDCIQILHNSQINLKNHYENDDDDENGSTSSLDSSCESNVTWSTVDTFRASDNMDDSNSIESIYDLNEKFWVRIGKNKIGEGFYGIVYEGELNPKEKGKKIKVAVKKLKEKGLESSLRDFENEINIMQNLKHNNIVEMKGFFKSESLMPKYCLVMEFIELGSLPCFIRIREHELTPNHFKKYAIDIAEGMEYLGNQKIIHRDLAARNILVSAIDLVKISDFGLAKALGDANDYTLKTVRDMPIKWYAPESIRGKFSIESDVWSYGVTLYEIFSYGKDPVIIVDNTPVNNNQEMFVGALEKGHRLPQPPKCPSSIYCFIMSPCWKFDPSERPTFTEIISLLYNVNDLQTL